MKSFIQYGFGPIGQKVAKYALDRGLELEAVIDSDPKKVGKNAGKFLGKKLDVIIRDDHYFALKGSKSGVVFLTTGSSLESVYSQIVSCAYHKKNIVSTCEELAYPWNQDFYLSNQIDQVAKQYGISVIGTGVNPGFTMDALPIFLTSICQDVKSIKVERYQDASIRRLPFQKKIGIGVSKRRFKQLVAEKKIRHVGFTESVQMIADTLGWKLDKIVEDVYPVIAVKRVKSEYLVVPKGKVCGVAQVCKGYMNKKPVITLELQAYLGHQYPHDAVFIKGNPDITSKVEGGINGDIATCAMVINCAKKVIESKPGLRTMKDIGLTSWWD